MRALIKETIADILDFSKNPQNRFYLGFILLFCLVSVGFSVYRVHIYMSDFNMFLDPAIDAKFHNINPFEKWVNNSYSPFFYAFMSLFSPFAKWLAVLIWSLLSQVFILLIFAIGNRMLAVKTPKKARYLLLAALLMGSLFFDNIQLGQSNVLMLFAMVVSVFYLSRSQHLKAGAFLGFAIAFKTLPLIFLWYFLLKGKLKAIAFSVGFALVFTFVAPLMVFTVGQTKEYLSSWNESVISPMASGDELKTTTVSLYHTNQSLDAFAGRFFTDYAQKEYGGLHTILAPANLTASELKPWSRGAKVLFLVFLSVLILINNRKKQGNYFTEMSWVLFAIVIISPVAWTSYYIVLLPMSIAIIDSLAHYSQFNSLPWKLVFGLGFLLIIADVSPNLQSYSLHFIGGCMLFVGSIFLFQKRFKLLK